MIPNVFVSSTIEDLHYLRDAMRELIITLGYNPVMSEYGEVGYLPAVSAVDSCYHSVRQCQLAILIVGKKYGTTGANDLSVTHHEFRTAKERDIPIITLVDRDVYNYMPVFDVNPGPIKIPGMEAPARTFAFLREIKESPTNNAVLAFTGSSDAVRLLRQQLAHIFGDYLRSGQDRVTADIRDVLSEIKTLRHTLVPQKDDETPRFMRAVRLLLDERFKALRVVAEAMKGSLEDAVPLLLKSSDFIAFLESASGHKPEILDVATGPEVEQVGKAPERRFRWLTTSRRADAESRDAVLFALKADGGVVMNQNAIQHYQEKFDGFRQAIESTTTPTG